MSEKRLFICILITLLLFTTGVVAILTGRKTASLSADFGKHSAVSEPNNSPSNGLAFTMDQYFTMVASGTKTEGLGSFSNTRKFIHVFYDGSGRVEGEYIIPNKRLLYLRVFGLGDVTSVAIACAVIRSQQIPGGDNFLLDTLSTVDLHNSSTVSNGVLYCFYMQGKVPVFFIKIDSDSIP